MAVTNKAVKTVSVYCGSWKEEVIWLSVDNEHHSENSVNYFI